jgi:hypothetical protein
MNTSSKRAAAIIANEKNWGYSYKKRKIANEEKKELDNEIMKEGEENKEKNDEANKDDEVDDDEGDENVEEDEEEEGDEEEEEDEDEDEDEEEDEEGDEDEQEDEDEDEDEEEDEEGDEDEQEDEDEDEDEDEEEDEDEDEGEYEEDENEKGDEDDGENERTGKDGERWKTTPFSCKTRNQNILREKCGPTRTAQNKVTSMETAFTIFLTPEMLELVVKHTNEEIRRRAVGRYAETTVEELKKFIGLLILAGVYRSRGEAVESLWGSNGRHIFPKTMAVTRFKNLCSLLRFDDKETRNNRQRRDKFAPIRSLFETATKQLPKYFKPGECVTIDESLIPFRGRCSFRQYMPMKPAKYGLKFFVAACSESRYIWGVLPYTGKDGKEVTKNLASTVVLKLTENLAGTGRNICTDNFYTSLHLCRSLKLRSLSLVGTMRKHRRELPPCALETRGRDVGDCMFVYNKDATLLSFIPRKKRVCLILSSMHLQKGVIDENGRGEINNYYNRCKGGVDSVDKLISHYSCKRQSRRWPMVVFTFLLDIACINAFVMFTSMNQEWNKGKRTRRRLFLEELGLTLASWPW